MAAVVSRNGVEVWPEEPLLPEFGPVLGKGDALWRALSKVRGDLVVFADTDTREFRAELVVGIAGYLLVRPEIRSSRGPTGGRLSAARRRWPTAAAG